MNPSDNPSSIVHYPDQTFADSIASVLARPEPLDESITCEAHLRTGAHIYQFKGWDVTLTDEEGYRLILRPDGEPYQEHGVGDIEEAVMRLKESFESDLQEHFND